MVRSYSVSGRVRHPGVKLLPAGSTIIDLIEACGGMLGGHEFKAYQPGGPSAGILPASINDIPLDFDTLQPHGSFIGSAAVVDRPCAFLHHAPRIASLRGSHAGHDSPLPPLSCAIRCDLQRWPNNWGPVIHRLSELHIKYSD